jgi:hypothetical protein
MLLGRFVSNRYFRDRPDLLRRIVFESPGVGKIRRVLKDPNSIFMTHIRLKINIPARAKKKTEVRSLIVDALF